MSIQITKSSETDWKPLIEEGVKTDGIYVKRLRFDEVSQRPPTFLLKFDSGASYPNHIHPKGEEVFVLDGEVHFNSIHLTKGDYLYLPLTIDMLSIPKQDALYYLLCRRKLKFYNYLFVL